MPQQDVEQAWDQLCDLIRLPWEADTPAVNGGTVVVLGFPGTGFERPTAPQDPRDATPWAFFNWQHVDGGQLTFGPQGQKRHGSSGTATLEIYAPGRDGLTLAHRLAKIGQNALKNGKTLGGLVTLRVRLDEAGDDGPWYHINVLADFEYDVI